MVDFKFNSKTKKETLAECNEDLSSKVSNIFLESRKILKINGVKEVISFGEEKIILNTVLGMLLIKGKDLKMNKLDVENGEINVVGALDSFSYGNSQAKKESLLEKIFK